METSSLSSQIRTIDRSEGPSRRQRRTSGKVDATLAELRVLHERLNAQLYANPSERPQINCPADAAELLTPFIGHLEHEEMWVINLDIRNRLRSMILLYKGNASSSQVRVGEVFREAVIENAPVLIVAHNHPSGDPTPSPDDVAVTRAIVQAGKLLEVDVLDHIVVCHNKWVSLKERGLGFG
jgi:DNA repair protein RadC